MKWCCQWWISTYELDPRFQPSWRRVIKGSESHKLIIMRRPQQFCTSKKESRAVRLKGQVCLQISAPTFTHCSKWAGLERGDSTLSHAFISLICFHGFQMLWINNTKQIGILETCDPPLTAQLWLHHTSCAFLLHPQSWWLDPIPWKRRGTIKLFIKTVLLHCFRL